MKKRFPPGGMNQTTHRRKMSSESSANGGIFPVVNATNPFLVVKNILTKREIFLCRYGSDRLQQQSKHEPSGNILNLQAIKNFAQCLSACCLAHDARKRLWHAALD